MQPQLRWSKNPVEILLGSFSQSESSAIADLDMTQMGVVGTIAAIPRLAKQNGKVNFPTLATYASCTRKFESQIRGHSADFLLPRLLYAGHCPKATDWNFNVPIPGEQKVRIFCRSSKLFLEYGT